MRKRQVTSKENMTSRKKRGIMYLLMAMPFILFIFAFCYVPLFGWLYSVKEYRIGFGLLESEFVGLKHFNKLIHDSDMIRIIRNTLTMSFLGILASPLPAIFAIMINGIRRRRLQKVVQTLTTLPNFIGWVVVFGIAYPIFSSSGLLNQVLEFCHLPVSQFGLIGDGNNVWLFQLSLGIWKSLGWNAIIYLAAITGIDQELYDAARVDGANKFQLDWHITVPGMIPTFGVLLLLNIGNLLSNGFEQYYLFWNPLVSDKIEVLDYYVYKLGFQTQQYSYSVALGMIKTLVSVLLLFTANRISKKIKGTSLF